MDKTERISIQLTVDQKKQIKDASGEDVSVLEFTKDELERRVAPAVIQNFRA